MSTIGESTTTETLECSCCPNCFGCPSGQLPTSFQVYINVALNEGSTYTFARFNGWLTVNYEASHTGFFGTSYPGWFFVSGVNDGVSDYTELAITCDESGRFVVNSYRYLATPSAPDPHAESIATGLVIGGSNTCVPLYIHSDSVIFTCVALGSPDYIGFRFNCTVTVIP